MNQRDILFFEELQNNAFPALQNVFYDGWSIRFGGGFTYRVNCANPMYPEALPPAEKLAYVENLYRASGLGKCIVKLHQGMEPRRLAQCQAILDEKGYGTERRGHIYVCDLTGFSWAPRAAVAIAPKMSEDWLTGFLTMNGTAEAQKTAASAMLRNIRYPIAAASIEENGKMIACGLGVLERGCVGLYDIFVDEHCRRRGLGNDICAAIMNYGRENGCQTAYLQVLADNHGARAMYRNLGYGETYEYWFRVKQV